MAAPLVNKETELKGKRDSGNWKGMDSILEPLNLPVRQTSPSELGSDELVTCLLCEEQFRMQSEQNNFLKHILQQHRLVIADVNLVADLKSYVEYWRERFSHSSLNEFCSVMVSNTAPEDKGMKEKFYLLADVLPEDKQIRIELQQKRLQSVLEHQQKEREEMSISRECLFCREHFEGSRATLFNHMAFDHNFSVGQPDNIVFGDEFLDLLKEKLNKLQCLYCEKTFKDRTVLKEHMRKKQHKKLNPRNTIYDKFYIVNYLEFGKNWEDIQKERDETDYPRCRMKEEEDQDWSDWKEEEPGAVCFFCDQTSTETESLIAHMKESHKFDFTNIKEMLNLNFYQQIKLVNYLRRQVHQIQCIYCHEKLPSREKLMKHMKDSDHLCIPGTDVWDQPQYYFPTYENDSFLCTLGNDDDSEAEDGLHSDGTAFQNQVVVPEDTNLPDSILQEEALRKNLMGFR